MTKRAPRSRYLRDVLQPCPICLALRGERCKGVRPELVHVARRMAALSAEADGRPGLLELVKALSQYDPGPAEQA